MRNREFDAEEFDREFEEEHRAYEKHVAKVTEGFTREEMLLFADALAAEATQAAFKMGLTDTPPLPALDSGHYPKKIVEAVTILNGFESHLWKNN